MAAAALMSHRSVFALLACALASTVRAGEIPPPAYQLAAQRAGIPSTVLFAVALQESGTRMAGRLVPWPWTLNVAGTPQRFATRAEACTGLRQALKRTPATRIDAGLGQINLGYHPQRYAQPCDLLDPYRNLAIAAEILREQHVTDVYKRQGNVNATSITTLLLSELKPKKVLMMGIAAGRRKKLSLGEVILSERVVYYEGAAALAGGKIAARPEMPRPGLSTQQDLNAYSVSYTHL